MTEYIYFVKCPNCDDEHFYFFNEAKEFALGCLTKKPIITQIEVTRNDFGECTDSCDLGTVWSWKELMNGIPEDSAPSILTKANLLSYDPDNDSEFNSLDNSLNSVPDNSKNPDSIDFAELHEDKYTRDLAKRMKALTSDDDTKSAKKKSIFKTDKNKNYIATWRVVQTTGMQSTVEDGFTSEAEAAQYVRDHGGVSKLKVVKNESFERKPIPEGMTIEQLVEEMEKNEDTVECVICNELFLKDDSNYDKDYGWICSDCKDNLVECTWCNDLFDRSECRYEVDLGWLCSRCEAAIKSRGETLTFREGSYADYLDESASSKETAGTVDFDYDDLTVTLCNPECVYAGDYYNPPEYENNDFDYTERHYTFTVSKEDVIREIIESHLTDDDVTSLGGNPDELAKLDAEINTAYEPFVVDHFDELFNKYKEELKSFFMPDAKRALGQECEYRDIGTFVDALNESCCSKESLDGQAELSEPDYELKQCPECGEEQLDIETGICNSCGFNFYKD